MVNIDEFNAQIEVIRERSQVIQHRVNNLGDRQSNELLETIEELSTTLEELRVAEDELRAQNYELIESRQQIEAERQRYQDLFEFAPDGYLVLDENGVILEANLAAAELLQIQQKFLTGKPLSNYVTQGFARRSFRNELNKLTNFSQPAKEWEVSLQPRHGEPFDAALTIAPIRKVNQDQRPALRVCIRDITSRKQAEAKISEVQLQNQQLNETVRLKKQFMAIMSHELRSPMNAILGFSQLLLRQRQNQTLTDKQTSMIESIFKSGQYLLTLIEDILDFSKIDADRLELDLKELNLADLITATVAEISSLAEQKRLELRVSIRLENPIIINDATRLRQVLINLLSNAIKFTDVGSVSIEVWESSEGVAIAIKDTGIGIAKTDMDCIFQEFRQAQDTLSRKYEGTGLGLSIARSLIQMMDGKVTVNSELGVGSTFQIELPRWVK